MKRKLLAAILAATLLLSGCQYTVVEDGNEVELSLPRAGLAEQPTAEATAPPIQKGNRDEEGETAIAQMQTRLIALDYLAGEADGIFGSGTETALKAFQAQNGIPETGMADQVTLDRLDDLDALPMPTPEPTLLASGAQGEDVTALQKKLIEYGFLTATADGDFGAKTDEAVKLYQQYLADHYSLEYSNPTPTPEPTIAPTPVPISTPAPDPESGETVTAIAKGSRDAANDTSVSDLQKRLQQLLYLSGKADGIFGGGTEEALKAFQKDNGLPETGEADLETLRLLSDAGTQPMETPEPTYAPDGVVTDELKQQILSGNFEIYREDLQRGSDGDEVLRLQRRLYQLLYLEGGIDGDFGGGTESAIKYFQKRNKLSETGKADEETQRRLFTAEAIKSDRPDQMYMLKISVSDQRVYAYKWVNGSYTKLARTMICSTGTKSDPTPYGTYTGGAPAGRWYYFKKFDCWAQYAWRFNGPYLFHSVLYSEKDTSTLRQSSVNNLGSRASHGCVRLKVEDAKWIYNNCPAGTTVKVV